MDRFLKQVLVTIISLFLTVVLLYLAAIIPATVMFRKGATNPPPPFDTGNNGIYFTEPMYQIPAFLLLLAAPAVGSIIAYLLNGGKREHVILLPMYIFYGLFIIYFALSGIDFKRIFSGG